MNRFLGSLLAVAFAMSVGVSTTLAASTKCPAGETYTKGYTKADGTKVSGYCSSHGSKASPAAAATAAAKAAPAAQSTAKAAAPAAAAATAKAATSTTKSATTSTSCPPGKTYVNGYTKANGTKVAGYCRSAPSK
jgi:hypothetical protein